MRSKGGGVVGGVVALGVWLAVLGGSRGAAGEWPPAEFANSHRMVFVRIPAGGFRMGSTDEEIRAVLTRYPIVREKALAVERPAHKVRLTRAFLMGKHEVTVGQFRKFVEATGYRTEAERNTAGLVGAMVWEAHGARFRAGVSWRAPGFAQTDAHPVVCVSWNDAKKFLEWLNANDSARPSGWTYRLPTEAEWEYAARGPESLIHPWGNAWDGTRCNLAARAAAMAFSDRSVDDGHMRTAPVGSHSPEGDSPFGLCNLAGNVSEWCEDRYAAYDQADQTDPTGAAEGKDRMQRGGCWAYNVRFCRGANRNMSWPTFRNNCLGFRLVLAVGSR